MVKVDPGRCKWLATGAGLAGSPSKKRSKTVSTRIPFFTLLAVKMIGLDKKSLRGSWNA
jgi:hypothetical protein